MNLVNVQPSGNAAVGLLASTRAETALPAPPASAGPDKRAAGRPDEAFQRQLRERQAQSTASRQATARERTDDPGARVDRDDARGQDDRDPRVKNDPRRDQDHDQGHEPGIAAESREAARDQADGRPQADARGDRDAKPGNGRGNGRGNGPGDADSAPAAADGAADDAAAARSSEQSAAQAVNAAGQDAAGQDAALDAASEATPDSIQIANQNAANNAAENAAAPASDPLKALVSSAASQRAALLHAAAAKGGANAPGQRGSVTGSSPQAQSVPGATVAGGLGLPGQAALAASHGAGAQGESGEGSFTAEGQPAGNEPDAATPANAPSPAFQALLKPSENPQTPSNAAAALLNAGAGGGPATGAGPEASAERVLANGSGPQSGGASSAEPDANAARLSRGLRNAVLQNNGALTLRLTPSSLGTVRIELNVQGGAVQASLSAENEGAKQLLQQQLGQLKSTLEGQGLSVQRLEVQGMTHPPATDHDARGQDNAHDGRSRQQYSGQEQPRRDKQGRGFEEVVQQVNAHEAVTAEGANP